MKSSTSPERIAGGIDQRYFPERDSAVDIHNFRYTPDGGWRNDRGWEPLIELANPTIMTAADLLDARQPCRFLAVWTRHSGSEEYYLSERNSILYYEFGNKGSATTRKHVLATNRHLPRSDEPGTQLVPYGRFSVILNGHDEMIKWWGRDKMETFGFMQTPPTPYVLPIQNNYNQQDGYGTGDPINNDLSGISVQFAASDYLGLGDPAKGSVNFYSYRISYITDTGSESPLSEPCNISWTLLTDSPDAVLATANARKYGVMLTGLEPGPEGTVARRIYRTKNKKDGLTGAGDIYYFDAQIDDNTTRQYLDVAPDNEMVNQAPSSQDSVPITSSHKYGAAWNGSMWLAGGDMLPTRIIYSNPGVPEQFAATSYFDVGVREGGHITALVPYYDVLLVFREHAVDAIFTGTNGYTCTTINQTVGTIATNSIVLIPSVGVMFLNKDGFYLISGGLRGGSSLSIEPASTKVEKELGRVSVNALARASATYSDKEKEYWCMYPVDGDTENTHGAAYNNVTQEWSFRGATDNKNLWPFARLATDSTGWIIIGLNPIYTPASGPTPATLYPGFGLQVWSASPSWGNTVTITAEGESFILTSAGVPAGLCIWQSAWNDFGDDSVKKRVLTVELDALTEGDNGIELQWASDYSTDWVSAGVVNPQIGDYAGSANTDPTYDNGANTAVWGTAKWQDHKVTRLRWDVKTGLVSNFSFRIITANVIQVVRYQENYIGGTVKSPNTRMPGSM